MSPTVVYKGFTIQGRAIPLADSGDWAAEAVVQFPQPSGGKAQQVPDPDDRTFTAAEDAEGYAINLAIRFVDRLT